MDESQTPTPSEEWQMPAAISKIRCTGRRQTHGWLGAEGVREKEQMGEEETEAVSLGKVSGRFCCVLVESREFQRGREVLGSYRVLEGWKPGEMEAAV